MLSCVGTCVNTFDEDGDCLVGALPWNDVSAFAVSLESAKSMTAEAFTKTFGPIPSEIAASVSGSLEYLVADESTLVLYDPDKDIHYFCIITAPANNQAPEISCHY